MRNVKTRRKLAFGLFTALVVGTVAGLVGSGKEVVGAKADATTFSFANTNQRQSLSSDEAVFVSGDFVLKQEKNTSSNAVADYINPIRIYNGHRISFTGGSTVEKIDSIVITASSGSYATATNNAVWTGATTTVTSSTVTAVATTNVKEISLVPTAQIRWNSLVINYTPAGAAFGELDSVAIENPANKLTFEVGETFSSEGLELKLGDDSDPIVYQYTTTGFATDLDDEIFDSSDIGSKVVTVSYEGFTLTYNISVIGAPIISSSMNGMNWEGDTEVSADRLFTELDSERTYRASISDYYNPDYMLGGYSSDADVWATFTNNEKYKSIANQLTANTYATAFYGQNFTIKNLNKVTFSWTNSTVGATSVGYILGSVNGGFSWEVLLSESIATATAGSMSWDSSTKYVDDEEVIVAFAYTSSVSNNQLNNFSFKYYGDSIESIEWAVTNIEVSGTKDQLLVNDSTTYTAVASGGEIPHNVGVTWSTSNAAVATVDASTGVVTSHSAGEVNIIATAADGNGTSGFKVMNVVNEIAILDSISLELVNPAKKYYVGTDITITDIVVTASYTADKANQVVTTAEIISGNPLVLGENTIEVSYSEVDAYTGTNHTKSNTLIVIAQEATTYAKVTSDTQVVLGATYVIARPDGTTTLSTTQNGNNRGFVTTEVSSNEIIEDTTIQEFELVAGLNSGEYGFKQLNGDNINSYLISVSGQNYLRSNGSLTAAGSWTITIGSGTDYEATITSAITSRTIKYNSGSSIFAAYASGQSAVSLFVDESTLPNPHEDAKELADWIMDAERDLEVCEDKFLEAWLMWDELSSEAQDLFMTHADFEDALARVRMWATANDYDWDVDFVGDSGSHLQRTTVTNSPEKALQGVLIIGVFGLTTLMGYYFLRKRRVI